MLNRLLVAACFWLAVSGAGQAHLLLSSSTPPLPSPTSVTPTSGSEPDNAAAGAAIATLGCTMSDSSACPSSAVFGVKSDPNGWTSVNGNKLQTAVAQSSTNDNVVDNITLEVTVNGVTATSSFALTITPAVTTAYGPGHYLFGTEGPYFEAAAQPTNGNEILGCGNENCVPIPMHYALAPWSTQSEAANVAADTSLATAANDVCQFGQCTDTQNNMVPNQYVYFIRICNEWQGNSGCGPYASGTLNPVVDATTWTNAIHNTITWIRQQPWSKNLKIAMDAPQDSSQDPYILPLLQNGDLDLLALDAYPGNSFNDGSDPTYTHAVWNGFQNTWLGHLLSVATTYNRPMVFPEWCDTYDDGYIITQLTNWFNTHNVVSVDYWDENDGHDPAPMDQCSLVVSSQKTAAYQAAYQSHKYSGTYWPVVIPH